MITDDLIKYIQKQQSNDHSKDFIVKNLIEAGWKESDIEEGFEKIDLIQVGKDRMTVDPYRERTEEEEEILKKKREEVEGDKSLELNNSPKLWTPVKINPIVDNRPQNENKGVFMTASSFKTKKIDNLNYSSFNDDDSVSSGGILNNNVSTPATPIRSVVFESFSKKNVPENWNMEKIKNREIDSGVIPDKKRGTSLWMTIFLIVLVIIGGLSFAVMKGYLDLNSLNFSFIKMDPKVLILNNSERLSSLKSYKTETVIDISSPTFANITNGLATGEKISSIDKDTINIKSLSLVNQNGGNSISSNFVTVRSSILENAITANIKKGDDYLFIAVPDLREIMGGNSPAQKVVKATREDIGLLNSVFGGGIQDWLKEVDLYKVLSGGLSSYISDSSILKYKNFIENVNVVEKDKEDIKGIATYHYDINTEKEATKELVKEVSANFFNTNLQEQEKDQLNGILSSLTVNSFEVWIGEDDNNIYQYKINLSVPLSKILRLEDSSIGDTEVNLGWVTTYYDFDISNEIILPEDSVTTDSFIKSFHDINLKNKILSLSSLTKTLLNSEGSYGKAVNNGSCVKPSYGSLFSPVGHSKGASLPVGDIANNMISILEKTNNVGFCYSNASSWAVSFPLEEKIGSYFCLDNKGTSGIIETELKNVKCGN